MGKGLETPKLGLRENISQFSLLVVVNAFVGAMVGLERTILPAIAERDFNLAAKSAIFSFIVVFGLTKALTNYLAGRLSDRWGRKPVLVAGWFISLPVPFLLMWAPSWTWVLIANAFLGVSQGLTWSTTVIMKIDLVGSKRRGFAMGLNEFAGYFAVAGSALATGYLANQYGLRPEPFYLGIAYAVLGLILSVILVRETHGHVKHETKLHAANESADLDQKTIFLRTSFYDRELSSVTQAGFINNLNDGMAWGLFPLLFAASGMSLKQIGWLAAIYPAVWGLLQLWTGHLSDSLGRKQLIVWGMWVQAIGIGVIALNSSFIWFATGGVLLGIGTAMVYPTLLAAIGDVAHPSWRASSVGIYRLWRDSGYAVGAVVAGITADVFGLRAAVWAVAAATFVSGVVVILRMRETLELRKDGGEYIAPAELCQVNGATLIDVRSSEEYHAGHVPGAKNIPLDEVMSWMSELSAETKIVTICGKGGGRSERAAEILRDAGFTNARSLCGGYQGWKAARSQS